MLAEEVVVLLIGHQSLAVDPKITILPKTPHVTVGICVDSVIGYISPNIPVVLGILMIRTTKKDFDILRINTRPVRKIEPSEYLRNVDAITIRNEKINTRH
jgi:hypothetical protein